MIGSGAQETEWNAPFVKVWMRQPLQDLSRASQSVAPVVVTGYTTLKRSIHEHNRVG